jgi:hypothetical protein
MSHYEDDRPWVCPEHLKGLTVEQLRERAEKLFSECEKKPPVDPRPVNA